MKNLISKLVHIGDETVLVNFKGSTKMFQLLVDEFLYLICFSK